MTKLSIQATNDCPRPLEDMSAEIIEALKEDYAYDDEVSEDYESEDYIEVSCGTRWNVQAEILQDIAKKYGVRIRAVGTEEGVGFVQVVCVDSKGEVVQDEEISFNF